jgi:hypothetical protein
LVHSVVNYYNHYGRNVKNLGKKLIVKFRYIKRTLTDIKFKTRWETQGKFIVDFSKILTMGQTIKHCLVVYFKLNISHRFQLWLNFRCHPEEDALINFETSPII